MSLRWTPFPLLLALAAATPGYAAAQPPTAPSSAATPSSVQRAEGHYKEGVRLFREKKWAEAEAAFEAAWALNPTVDVASNLGNAEYRQGKYREAAEHLAFALRAWPLMAAMAAQRPVAEQRLAESRTHVGALTVSVNVAQAEVLVDGKAVGKAPLRGEVFVEPGAHTVEAKLEGYASAKEAIAIEKGAARTIELTLVSVVREAGKMSPARVTSPRNPTNAVRSTPPSPVVLGIGIGTGVAFGAVGIGTLVASNSKDDDRASLLKELGGRSACWPGGSPSARCSDVLDLSAAERTFRGIAIASFVTSGVALGATLVYGLWPRRGANRSEPPRIVPTPSAHGGGFALVGTF